MKVKFLLLFFLVLLSSPVSAQVFVEQGKVNVLVHPGEQISDAVTVSNTTGKTVKARIYWEDFSYQSPFDGAKKFAPAGTLKTSLASWVKFSPRDVVLPAFGKVNISYVIDVPQNASGGYYGVLFVEPQNTLMGEGDKGVRIITRVGSLFFVETGDRNKTASLADVSIQGKKLKARLRNSGNVVLLPEASFYVMDREGLAMDRGEIKKYYLPPDGVVDIEVALGSELSKGEYTMVLTFDLQDGDVLVKEIEFSKNSDIEYQLRNIRD